MGSLQKKCRTTGKRALAYRGKGGQNTGTASLALRLRVVLYLLTLVGEKQKGTAGRGLEKNVTAICDKRHENLRHFMRQFATFYNNFCRFVPLS